MLFLFLLLAIILSIVWWTVKNGISPMPTSRKVKAALLETLPYSSGEIVDLGSGWGTLVFPLAQAFPHSKVTGYETSPLPLAFSRLRLAVEPRANLSLKREDFFHISLENVDLVLCYLYPGAMQKLQGKFERELKEGAIVVSHTFALPGWIPYKVLEVNDLYKTKIYFYSRLSQNQQI